MNIITSILKFGVILNKVDEYAIKLIENITKEGMSITYAGLSTLYKHHGGDLFTHAKDSYFNTRFNIRIKEFKHEEEKLDKTDKERFYNNIDHTKLNYLFELLEKARTTTFDVHAKILAKLYGKLLKHGKLSYYELSLLTNINLLNTDDIDTIYNFLKTNVEKDIDKNKSVTFEMKSYEDTNTFQKCIQLGIVREASIMYGDEPTDNFNDKICNLTKFSYELFSMFDEILITK